MTKKIFHVSIVVMIILTIVFRYFSIFKRIKRTNSARVNSKLSENFYEEDGGELDFNSSSLIVQAENIEMIEDHYDLVSSKNLVDDIYLLNFENPVDTENAYYEYKDNPEITNVLKDYKAHISGVRSGFEAWGVTSTGMDKYTNKLEADGNTTEVRIAVLDTGINKNHEVFCQNVLADRLDMTYAYDYVNDDNDPDDDNGHGTMVAGAIVEATPSNVKVVPVKVMGNDGKGNFSDIFNAMKDLSTKVDIINLSLGNDSSEITPDDFETLEGMIKSIVDDSDVIIVCAAGNSSSAVEYPAASSYTLAASAIDEKNDLASFSCYGAEIDFALPGDKVVLPYKGENSSYVTGFGTSISCPFLAASIALVKAENPGYRETQIIEVLKRNAIDLGPEGKDDYFGYGSIDFNTSMFASGVEVEVINKTNQVATVFFDENDYSAKSFVGRPDYGVAIIVCNLPCFVLSTRGQWSNISSFKFGTL